MENTYTYTYTFDIHIVHTHNLCENEAPPEYVHIFSN